MPISTSSNPTSSNHLPSQSLEISTYRPPHTALSSNYSSPPQFSRPPASISNLAPGPALWNSRPSPRNTSLKPPASPFTLSRRVSGSLPCEGRPNFTNHLHRPPYINTSIFLLLCVGLCGAGPLVHCFAGECCSLTSGEPTTKPPNTNPCLISHPPLTHIWFCGGWLPSPRNSKQGETLAKFFCGEGDF